MMRPLPGKIYIVNIKADMPTADVAVRRVNIALGEARQRGAVALKLIHGYGSTGVGGRIRTETRRHLEALRAAGKIRSWIAGESFSIFDAATRSAFANCEALRQDSDLDRQNNGVTVVVL
jgi:hypothetical protein